MQIINNNCDNCSSILYLPTTQTVLTLDTLGLGAEGGIMPGKMLGQ